MASRDNERQLVSRSLRVSRAMRHEKKGARLGGGSGVMAGHMFVAAARNGGCNCVGWFHLSDPAWRQRGGLTQEQGTRNR